MTSKLCTIIVVIIAIILCNLYNVSALDSHHTLKCRGINSILEDCFAKVSPPILESIKDNKNPAEITQNCIVLRKGMNSCIDSNIQRCNHTEGREIFDQTTFGSSVFIEEFCNHEKSETASLKHERCFVSIQKDAKKCARKFLDSINKVSSNTKIISRTSDVLDIDAAYVDDLTESICCADLSVAECLEEPLTEQCDKGSKEQIKFALKRLFNEAHLEERKKDYCDQYGKDIECPSSGVWYKANTFTIVILTIISALLVKKI